MPSHEITVDSTEIKGVIPQLRSNLVNALTLRALDTNELNATYFHILFAVVVLTMANYIAYVVAALLRLRIGTLISTILVPIIPILGCMFLCIFSYILGSVYADMLSDQGKNTKRYIYICILGSVYLPIAVLVTNILGRFYFITFLFVAIVADVFCRGSLTAGRHFESSKNKWEFVLISIVANFGFYVVILPLFYTQ